MADKRGSGLGRERLLHLRKKPVDIYLLGIVRGLLKEADLVKANMGKVRPKAIALTCNPTEASSLGKLQKEAPLGFDLTDHEQVRALGRMMWSWECDCGHMNPHGGEKCIKCGRPRTKGEGSRAIDRIGDGSKPGHGASDNIWAETGGSSDTLSESHAEDDFMIGDVLSMHDEMYLSFMKAFGEVRFPDPAFMAATGAGSSAGIGVVGVDLEEEEFTDLHLKEVGYIDLFRSGRAIASIEKRGIRAETPEELAIEWDRRVAGFGGYRRVEEARTRHIAERLLAIGLRHSRVLCVVEIERLRPLARRLQELNFKPL